MRFYTTNEICFRRNNFVSKSMNTPRIRGSDIFLNVSMLIPDTRDNSLQVVNV